VARAAAQARGEAAADGMEAELPPQVEQRSIDHEHEVASKDTSWCGSGKKFKKCHGS